MPVLFVGHGNPMNAIEDNEFSRAWGSAAKALPKPKAILCISAHWETEGAFVTASPRPELIYDFYGFPDALYEKKYPVPGSSELAQAVVNAVQSVSVKPDHERGIDHGAWSVLCRMYPKADIPVVQLSLDAAKPPQFHYELGKELKALREQGVLIIGSGNLVHNLGRISWDDKAFDWAIEFDARMKELIQSRDHRAIINYKELGASARLAVPTNEHFLPLLYVLALQEKDESVSFFAEKVTLGSISMRSLQIA
jgi:4,5-DOPA dioxygenase extradiol